MSSEVTTEMAETPWYQLRSENEVLQRQLEESKKQRVILDERVADMEGILLAAINKATEIEREACASLSATLGFEEMAHHIRLRSTSYETLRVVANAMGMVSK